METAKCPLCGKKNDISILCCNPPMKEVYCSCGANLRYWERKDPNAYIIDAEWMAKYLTATEPTTEDVEWANKILKQKEQ